MKYIRTKERVLTCLDTNTLKVGDWVGINEPILAKSDTIEELCDDFVCGDNYKAHCVLSSDSFEHSYWRERLLDNDKTVIIYGAIWTEWGLKYVAKTNDKGELELL